MRLTAEVLLLALLFAACCAVTRPEAKISSAVEAAWLVAETSCMETQKLIVARETAGLQSPAETDAALVEVRKKCDAVTTAFEAIREAL